MTQRALFSGCASVVGLTLLVAGCGADGSGTAGAFYDTSTEADAALTVKCGESTRGPVQGYDVSVYQGNFSWPAVQFGAARISDGSGYIDSTFDGNWAEMKSKGIIRAAYQFFEPGESEVAQANLVIHKVGRLGNGDLPVMLDIEVTGGQSPATIQARARHWLQLVEAGTGKRPFVYSYGSFLQRNLGSGFGDYPLWIANYGSSCPSVPSGWSNWVFWQYSDGGGHLDHDVFNGNQAQLLALAGAAAPVTPVPPVTPVGPPTAPPPAPAGCGSLQPGTGIARGQGITSCDGRFTLTMQSDGNLVLYLKGSGALWSTHTGGSDGYAANLQGDGNLVLYGKNSNALWASHTSGHHGATLDLQGDGNLVLYESGRSLWSTQTFVMQPPAKPSGCSAMTGGFGIVAGESFTSCDGHYALAMQTDGNLVLYHGGKGAIWQSLTAGSTGYAAIMQTDGNLVVYGQRGNALFQTKTYGHAGARLDVQTDGNLVIYQASTPLWSTHTSGK
jgi:GH25 family lysozyme M1 (1,4-beta-N-acetylmuramidase)